MVVGMRINAAWCTVDKIIVSGAPRGRLLALHKHRSKRVRRKYAHAIVFMRGITKDTVHDVSRPVLPLMSWQCKRRMCHALRKMGIDARVERASRVRR